MKRYTRNAIESRRRRGRRILPMLFFCMLTLAAVLVVPRMLPLLPDKILVIRDPSSGEIVPLPTETDTGTTDAWAPDQVVTSPMLGAPRAESLQAETGSLPADDLPTLNSDGVPERPPAGLYDRVPDDYDYTSPIPLSDPVTLDYFRDAVFIGDSRMQGFILYNNLASVTSYTYKGLTVDSLFTREVIDMPDLESDEEIGAGEVEGKVTVMQALAATEFTKVYIMLGINETGWPDPTYFPVAYAMIIDAIREISPQALIYVQSIFPVTQSVSDTHAYVTNEKIELYNGYLRQLCADKKVFLLDLVPSVANASGVLPDDSGVDGIHLNKTYCGKVLDWVLTHVVPLE